MQLRLGKKISTVRKLPTTPGKLRSADLDKTGFDRVFSRVKIVQPFSDQVLSREIFQICATRRIHKFPSLGPSTSKTDCRNVIASIPG